MFTFKLRRDHAQVWSDLNPILADGEPGFEIDTYKLKVGDGNTRWNNLPYLQADISPTSGGGVPITDAQILAHINSAAPHPVYDDGPSLLLLYQNAKV